MSFLDTLLTRRHPYLKAADAVVKAVAAEEAWMQARSDVELREVTHKLRNRIAAGETLEQVLPTAFAATREAARRTLNERHYDVQIIGGYVLHRGGIAEMRTGEGKTLVATLPAYLNALMNKGVHVVTVNDYLARRDAVWMGQVFAALGMSVGVINHDSAYRYDASHTEDASLDKERDALGSFKIVHEFLKPVERKEAYTADITYGTNNEYGFDYLRDNLEYEPTRVRQLRHHYAIVDEVDSILIDEARTPLIISGPVRDPEDLYKQFAVIAATLQLGQDYTVDEKARAVLLTPEGIEKAERSLGIENIYAEGGAKLAHHLEAAVKAQALYQRDKEYVVKDNEVVIVDEYTGRLQPGRRWSEGLHQAIEAKEGVSVQRESQTYASITFQNYFRMYEKVSGMTGTGLTSGEEFLSVYNLEVVAIPTHRTIARKDEPDKIYQNENGKFKAIATEVKARHEKGQPVLIGTTSIEMNERLSGVLRAAGIPHELLNAKNHEREGEIIAAAGKPGAVTVATNMAGRGVDIKLGGPLAEDHERQAVRDSGGLFVIGTERHDARRIDNQLRGRAGRQGDPGETQFYVSMEDKLMRIFASDMVKRMMGTLGIAEDEPIQSGMVSRALEGAQEKIEGANFDSRKHVLGFDDVLNHQRTTIYSRRRDVLLGNTDHVIEHAEEHLAAAGADTSIIEAKRVELGEDVFVATLRRLLLQAYDMFWIQHLETMDYLRNSVNLRSYGGRDPFVEYRKEGLRLFRTLEDSLARFVADAVPRLAPPQAAAPRAIHMSVSAKKKYERNDQVTITNGSETQTLKYKKAEPLLQEGWRIVEGK
ncbi:MAG: preprotein translocase subunit SecA [Patescibacteria group bacterium]